MFGDFTQASRTEGFAEVLTAYSSDELEPLASRPGRARAAVIIMRKHLIWLQQHACVIEWQ